MRIATCAKCGRQKWVNAITTQVPGKNPGQLVVQVVGEYCGDCFDTVPHVQAEAKTEFTQSTGGGHRVIRTTRGLA